MRNKSLTPKGLSVKTLLIFSFAFFGILSLLFFTFSKLKSDKIIKTVEASADGVHLYENKNNDFKVSFGYQEGEKKEHLVKYELDKDTYIIVQLLDTTDNIQASKTTIKDQDIIKFENVYKDTNIFYEISDTKIKELLELKSGDSPSKFTYSVVTHGVTLKQTDDGGYMFTPDNKKLDSFGLPPLFMVDGGGELSYEIKAELQSIPDSVRAGFMPIQKDEQVYRLIVSPNTEWLKSESRKFPILIDPSIVHDTKTEFANGSFNRIEDGGSSENSPLLKLKAADGSSTLDYGVFTSAVIDLGTSSTVDSVSWSETKPINTDVELQTRTSTDGITWEAWKPTTGETNIANMDSDSTNWSLDSSTNTPQVSKSDVSNPKAEGNGSMKVQQGILQADANTVGLWHFDETNGDLSGTDGCDGTATDICDATSNNNNGEINGPTTPISLYDGISGYSRSFPNDSDYINIPPNLSLQPINTITVEAWVYPSAIVPYTTFVQYGKTAGQSYGLNVDILNNNPGKPQFAIYTNTWHIAADSSNLPINKWSYLVGTFNGSELKLYIDGVLKTTTPYSGNLNYDGTVGLNFSGYYNPYQIYGGTMDGKLDEVRISNNVRTPEEIAEAYRLGRDHYLSKTISSSDLSTSTKLPFYVASDEAGTTANLTVSESAFANYQPDSNTVGLWQMEETNGAGAYIKDSSGNNNNGTPTGVSIQNGYRGKAAYLNGSGNISIPDNDAWTLGGGDFSISSWIKLESTTEETIVSHWYAGNQGSGQNGWLLYIGGTLGFVTSTNGVNNSTTWNSGWSPSINRWYYINLVRQSGTVTLYVDGVSIATTTINDNIYNATTPLYIGRYAAGNIGYYNGYIDELIIDNTARSSTQVRQAYEVGKRTHAVKIDFGASLDAGNLITNSSDKSFTIDATTKGFSTKGKNLFQGEKVIVKENYAGVEYIAQGDVASANESTGAVTVSSWDSGSTFPTGGFTAKATVFKWQREYMDLTGIDTGDRDAITKVKLQLINGSEGRNIWLDGLLKGSYATTPAGTVTGSSAGRYLQYKAILTSTDGVTTPGLSGVTINYTEVAGTPNTVTIDDEVMQVVVEETGANAVVTGASGSSVELNLKKKATNIADITLNLTSPRDLSGLTADVDKERGISFMHYDDGTNCGGEGCEYTDIPGAVGASFTFYVPRDPKNDAGVCIVSGADSLSDFNGILDEASCTSGGGVYTTGGVAGQYTVTRLPNSWQVAGATATGGISISNNFDIVDTMTRLQVEENSNHTLSFGTINGLTVSGESFSITFPTEFNLENIVIDDLDVADDGVDIALCTGAKSCVATATEWGVAIDDATDNSITFTTPTTSGYIAGGSAILVEIGTNTTSQATGTHQIANPITPAEYQIQLQINNTDITETGEVTLPIVDDDTVNISGYLDTTLTFDIDTTTETGNTLATGNCDTAGGANPCDSYEGAGDSLGYVVSVGEMTTNTVNKSHQTTVTHADGNTGVINSIFFDLETNAQGGAVVTVLSRYGGMYLDPGNILTSGVNNPSSEIEVTEGSGRYGIQSVNGTHFVNSASGTLNIAADCDGVENGVGGPAGNFYCGVTSLEPTEIFNTGTNPVEEARVEFGVGVAPSSTNATGTYEDYLTFIATGTF